MKSAIDNSNMSTFNCLKRCNFQRSYFQFVLGLTVKLARTVVNLIQWQLELLEPQQKDKIAICGYHGWHDWYLAANIKNKNNLDNHLFSIYTLTVFQKLKDTVFTFKYNNINELNKII